MHPYTLTIAIIAMAVCQCDYVDENSKLIKNISNVKKTCVSGIEECLKTLLVDSGLNTVAWGKIYKTNITKIFIRHINLLKNVTKL